MQILRSLRSLLGALLFHVWRCMRGRPLFVHIPDTKGVLVLFLSTSLITTALLSVAITRGLDEVPIALLGWSINLFGIWLVFARRDRSYVLLGTMFGAFAGVDILHMALVLLFSIPPGGNPLLNAQIPMQVLRIYAMYRIFSYFKSLPAYVRARGYSPEKDFQ